MTNKGKISKELQLLIITSDKGFAGHISKIVENIYGKVKSLPASDFKPENVEKRQTIAVIDCRSSNNDSVANVEKLRRADKYMPILAITGGNGFQSSDRLFRRGAHCCVEEDTPDDVIFQIIRSLVNMRRSTRKYERLEQLIARKNRDIREVEQEKDSYKLRLAKRVQEQITVYRVSRAMLSVFDFDALANEIVELAARELGAEIGSLMLIEGEMLVVRALSGHVPGEDELLGRSQKVGEGISGWVAKEGKPLLITDIDKHPTFRQRGGVRYKTKSCISCPIIARGRIRGVVNITNKKGGGFFTEDDMRLLRTLAMTAAIALDNFELIDQIKRSETMSSIGELATRMAHEIRNPLHAIKMTIQILEKKFQLDESDREYYDILIGEIDRLETLVKEVLSFARKDQMEFKKCDITALLDRTLAVFKGVLDEKNIKIDTSYDPDLPLVELDEKKFEQAVMNLVINAIEAMKPGGNLRISTHLSTLFVVPLSQYGEEIRDRPRVHTRYAHISIADNGVGIEKHFADRIFTPFFTTKVHGTGLGLSTTRKIVEAHGGKLSFKSKYGAGTTFLMEIPVKE